MGWNEDREVVLKKLWIEGLSASQIAKQLGGVTRNAVIGKVHRLGLSGRATPSTPHTQRRPTFKAERVRSPGQHRTYKARGPRPASEDHMPQQPNTIPEIQEDPGSATILTLGAHMCKWPIGDPASDSFTFCGRRTDGSSYCVEHKRRAYQPQQKGKRATVAELTRSLRRYI